MRIHGESAWTVESSSESGVRVVSFQQFLHGGLEVLGFSIVRGFLCFHARLARMLVRDRAQALSHASVFCEFSIQHYVDFCTQSSDTSGFVVSVLSLPDTAHGPCSQAFSTGFARAGAST